MSGDSGADWVVRVLDGRDAGPRRHPRIARWAAVVAVGLAAVVFVLAGSRATSQQSPSSQSPPLADLDLTVPVGPGLVESWLPGRITHKATVREITSIGRTLVAVGRVDGQAAAWNSSFGDRWDRAHVQLPGIAGQSAITHAARLDGQTFGFGPLGTGMAVWQAVSADRWGYLTTVVTGDAASLIDVAATDKLLALVDDGGSIAGFSSDDGVKWVGVVTQGLDAQVQIRAVAGHDGWFYAVGSDCSDGTRRAVVRRSVTGSLWEAVPIPVSEEGTINDIASVGDGLLAVGETRDGDGTVAALVLMSHDGRTWRRVEDDAALAASRVSVSVLSTSPTDGIVTLSVDGATYKLSAGRSVDTDAGSFAISEVEGNQVALTVAGDARNVAVGETVVLSTGVALERVSAFGKRVVVAGLRPGDGGPVRAGDGDVWSSDDGGTTWSRDAPNGIRETTGIVPYTYGASVVLIASSPAEALTWASQWRTDADDELDYAAPGS